MKPNEFTSFEEALPDPHRWLIITNNIKAINAHNEMSHVWLTTFWTASTYPKGELVSFDDSDIVNILKVWRAKEHPGGKKHRLRELGPWGSNPPME